MKFIDLFAGIGGFHLALSKLGMECVFASEMDSHARATYQKNFALAEELFNDDIRNASPEMIPDHDILCAGFPCQPFSQAGHKRGFADVHDSERGNLFFNIASILEAKKPKAFILENVRHLLNHDNGNTFKRIKEILEELNYTVYYKVIKASEFGRPQHRPRIFIVGFHNEQVSTVFDFQFPQPIGCSMTMSDVFEGECTRDVGLTLRVGGRGSPIDDRRNWDGYIVDGIERRLSPKEGKRMMGFPDDFYLPTAITQSMKQLGNSVCVDVVYHVAKEVQQYLQRFSIYNESQIMDQVRLNKGEWSELYAFLKMLYNPTVPFGDTQLQQLNISDYITVFQLNHNGSDKTYTISGDQLKIDAPNATSVCLPIANVLNDQKLDAIYNSIRSTSTTTFNFIDTALLNILDITQFKGTSLSKPDINVGFNYQGVSCPADPMGIKSFIGASPTLLNAGSTTNFIFKVVNFQGDLNEVNRINGRRKIKDRLDFITNHGGEFIFSSCQNLIFQQNINLVDGDLLTIISQMLLGYYSGEGSKISDLITEHAAEIKIKRFLNTILLAMFPGRPWDGKRTSNGTIIIDKQGDLLLYHILKQDILDQYLFENTKLDTASTSRHGFGSLYKENDGFYFKLNLQIRNN